MKLVQQPNGIYWLQYWNRLIRQDRYISLKTKNKKEAEKRLAQYQADFSRGIYFYEKQPEQGSLYFTDVARECKSFLSISKSSIVRYKNAERLFTESCGDKPIKQYVPKDWFNFIAKCRQAGYNPNTIKCYNVTLKKIFAYALDVEYIDRNIIKSFAANTEGEIKAMPLSVYEDFMRYAKEHIDEKYYLYFKHLYLLALRPSEALSIKWEDIDFEHEEIIIYNSKRNRYDILPMLSDVKEFYETEFKDVERAGLVHDITFRRLLYKFKLLREDYIKDREMEFDYTLYAFRKSRASHLANDGSQALDIMKYMRHKHYDTTNQYYAKVDRKAQKNRMDKQVNQQV
jgi:integrase/recombinase XerD